MIIFSETNTPQEIWTAYGKAPFSPRGESKIEVYDEWETAARIRRERQAEKMAPHFAQGVNVLVGRVIKGAFEDVAISVE